MSIDIERVEADEFDRWDRWAQQSRHTNPFHLTDALEAQAACSGTDLHALAGFKGQEPVGIFPFFERTEWPLAAGLSPPTSLGVPRLGPALLNMDKLKRRKAERRSRQFVRGCLEWVERQCDARYVHVSTVGNYRDLRPFAWHGADVSPEYTYVVDLTPDSEDLLGQFSSDARRNVRGTDDDAYDIEVGGPEDVSAIVEQVQARYDAQGKTLRMPASFPQALYDALPEGQVRPYVCSVDGEYAGGILTVEDETRIYRWQGGVKHDLDLPVNDLLDWHIMTDAKARGRSEYDLVGASELRLSKYKAKFAPSLETFHVAEAGPWPVRALVDLYVRYRP